MKNKNLLFGLVGIFMILALSIVSAGTITRDFSDSSIKIGDEITVTLTVDVDTENYYAIDELISSEFEIVNKGEGDISEEGHIKFIIIQDAEDITYTYKIKAIATGDYDFTGTYMFEGDSEEQEILGEDNLIVRADNDKDNDEDNNLGSDWCITDWKCSEWSDCIDGTQIRNCSKQNSYCHANNKPIETKSCSIEDEDSKEVININRIGTDITVGDMVSALIGRYQSLLISNKDLILKLMQLQGKKHQSNAINTGSSLNDIITPTNYYLTTMDFFLLSQIYQLPLVVLCRTKIPTTFSQYISFISSDTDHCYIILTGGFSGVNSDTPPLYGLLHRDGSIQLSIANMPAYTTIISNNISTMEEYLSYSLAAMKREKRIRRKPMSIKRGSVTVTVQPSTKSSTKPGIKIKKKSNRVRLRHK